MTSPITLVLLNAGIAFLLAAGSVLIIAAVARYVGGSFASDRASRVGAFGVAIGYALGRLPGGTVSMQQVPSVASLFGAVAGLIIVWAWLVRDSSPDLGEVDG